jgi:hypothetical protein
MAERKWRWLGLACAVLVVLGAVVGLTTGDTHHGDNAVNSGPTDAANSLASADVGSTGVPSTTIPYPQAMTSAGKSAGAGATGASPDMATGVVGPVPAPLPTGQAKIVKNATINLEVKKGGFRSAFDSAASIAAGHGGYVVSSDSTVQDRDASTGGLVIRVPADSFDAVRAELAKLGTVKDERLNGQDVSGQLVDLDARIKSLQAQEEAIRALMTKAKTVGETIEVQGQLTQVRQQIEQLAGEKARLDGAASYATLQVRLAEPGVAAKPEDKPRSEASPVRQSITRAAHGAELVVAGTIVVLGWALPLGLLALPAWALWRLAVKARRPRPSAA